MQTRLQKIPDIREMTRFGKDAKMNDIPWENGLKKNAILQSAKIAHFAIKIIQKMTLNILK